MITGELWVVEVRCTKGKHLGKVVETRKCRDVDAAEDARILMGGQWPNTLSDEYTVDVRRVRS